jgi:hypothetical protein
MSYFPAPFAQGLAAVCAVDEGGGITLTNVGEPLQRPFKLEANTSRLDRENRREERCSDRLRAKKGMRLSRSSAASPIGIRDLGLIEPVER